MHITRLELTNIKSHRDSKYVFERGTTAIVGQNGAGKTTILEAIAWTLFDLLDYKKDDFVSRGQKKGSVRLAFISGADEREYEVYRDTGTSYYAFDPQLKTKIADKKEEVQRFLWLHLGVEPGTDLETLFRRAIGVPQGTFTAIFLESPGERKKAFDKLLKVEEYRQGADKLLETQRYVEGRIASVREKIARAEGQLERVTETQGEVEEIDKAIGRLRIEVSEKESKLSSQNNGLRLLDDKALRIAELKAELEKDSAHIKSLETLLERTSNTLQESQAAVESLVRCRVGHEAHLESIETLRALEIQRSTREQLKSDLAEIETRLVRTGSDIQRLSADFTKTEEAASKIEELTPLVAEQARLEESREVLRGKLAGVTAAEEALKSVDESIARLREVYKLNKDALRKAEEGLEKAARLESIKARDLELGREMATLRSTIEYNDRFRSEIQKGLCPILSEKCLNLKPGQTLESFISEGSAELTSRLSELEKEEAELRSEFSIASASQRVASSLEALRARDNEIASEGKALKERRERLLSLISEKESVETEIAKVISALVELDNPASRLKIFKEVVATSEEIKTGMSEAQAIEGKLVAKKIDLEDGMRRFAGLDAELQGANLRRDSTESDHRAFIANEKIAEKREQLQVETETIRLEITEVSQSLESLRARLADETSTYDPMVHAEARESVRSLESSLADDRAQLRTSEARATRLAEDLKRMALIRKSLEGELEEKKRLEEVLEVTAFIRDTLREAAPRVARNYVHHVSIEAAQMFREITGNPEFGLKWADDYGIVLEESGYDRPFANLSGGEQMVAALAVRLALLKQMSEIRIAFFDEPTTNMDADRRERLAEQISQITQHQTFEQLFIISHDDTFESYVDNLITVGEEF